MIVRKSNSQRVPPCSAREGRASSTDALPDHHNASARERLIDAERGNPFLHDLTNEPSARILIETEVGGVAALFIFQPFHLAELSDA